MRRAVAVVLAGAPVPLSAWLLPRAGEAVRTLLAASGGPPTDVAPAAVVAAVPTVVAAAATGWLATTVLLACVVRMLGTGSVWLLRATPRPWRFVVVAITGCSTLALAPASIAADGPAGPSLTADVVSVDRIVGLALPDRPARSRVAAQRDHVDDADRPHTPARPRRPRATGERGYVVRPGDTLWSIASAELAGHGRPTTVQLVDRRWRRWYAANRPAVGDDPDLLVPGTRLQPPGAGSAGPSHHDRTTEPPRTEPSSAEPSSAEPRDDRGDR